MNEFQNKLIIREEVYQNGFFPKVPKVGKSGSALILTGGCDDDIIVSEYTTAKQIRQGRYTQLVEISTRPYIKEITFNSPSKETHYSFNVYVKAVIQVKDPINFYENKNIDVDTYFDNLFSLDVRKITRKYSILDYNGMDDELTQKLSSYNTIDESTGFSYQISVVDAMPGEKAEEYVQQHGKQQLDAMLKQNARLLAKFYTDSYEDAIKTAVAEGKISEIEGIERIKEYQKKDFEEKVSHLEELREKGFITDKDAKSFVMPVLEGVELKRQEKQLEDETKQGKMFGIDEFYTEEEEK